MKNNKTVIISCAGMGKRLGVGTTKALVSVGGKPLIIRTLEQLDEVEDVRVVVGYQAEKVIEVVKAYRKDVTFVFNHDYMNNGTAASVSLALPGAKEFILTIDGDIIIHPDDMKILLDLDYECICGCKIGTDDPVKYSVNTKGEVVSFSREYGDFEWTGVCHIKTSNLKPAEKHVYQMIEPLLPKKSLFIRVKEIDTPDDYIRAEKWLENNYEDDVVIGIGGGMGSYATLSLFERILNAFPAKKEWDRPRVIIDNNCTMPSRVRAILYNENKSKLIYEMTTMINNLIKSGATDIILACNTSHVFLPEIYEKIPNAKNYIHNIIDDLTEYCTNENIQNSYILASEGTIDSKIYSNKFEENNLTLNYSVRDYEKVRYFIELVKTNSVKDENLKEFATFVNSLDFENIILGCTELPVLYAGCLRENIEIKKNILDPLEISIGKIKEKYNKIKIAK